MHRRCTIESVRAELTSEFFSFGALADIANASKHFVLDRGARRGLSSDDFKIGPGAAFSDGSYFSDGSTFSDAPDVVVLEFNGHRVDVLHLCEHAFSYLQTKMLAVTD